MSPLPGLVLALLSLVAWTAAAQSPTERMGRVRRVPLTGSPVDVSVAPGIPTTLNFDADIHPGSVELEPQGRIKLLSVAARAITLMPGTELGEAVALRVRFAEACSALEPGFSLRTDAAAVDAQVLVYRDARAPDLLLAQVAEWAARTTACEGEVAALRERGAATGPAAMVLSGQLGEEGVRVDEVDCGAAISASGLACAGAWRFLTETWVVVSMQLMNPPGQPVWKPGKAWLVSESRGERIPARVVALDSEALAPDVVGRLVVEFARPPPRAGSLLRLEVREAEGSRHLSLTGVTLDDAKTPARKEHAP